MAEIELDCVAKRYPDGALGLGKTSFTVRDGEFFILVGPSGCGKSTLLNMIVGLETLSEGEVRVDGRRIDHVDPRDRNMAMVFQSYALYPHMTVRENIAFPLKLAKLPRDEIGRRVAEAGEMLQLTELLDRKPLTLSGGQRQRVAMGRAIVRQPAVFLMDEPLSNLDARLRVQMRAEIARLQRRLGITTVYVTHDQTEAMTLGDRVAVLKGGEVQQIGSPRELYLNPANLFVGGFIGSPGMNFMPAAIRGRHLVLPFAEIELPGSLTCRLPRRQDAVIAGIRPEDLCPSSAAGCAQAAGASFPMRVEVVEWLGAEVFVHGATTDRGLAGGNAGPVRLIARLQPGVGIREGERVELCLDPLRLHLFDAGSGKRLLAPW